MLFFAELFKFLLDLMRMLQRIENTYCLFYWWAWLLIFCFLSNQENLYIIHHNSDLFYDIYNITNEHNWRQTHRFQIILISIFKWIKKLFSNFVCFIINHDLYVITFSMHYMLLIIIYRRSKVVAIVNWIFHMSDTLGLFMIFFNYGLILLRYSSTDRVLFLPSLLSYSI